MLLQESQWYKEVILKYIKPGSLILNIGSSTKEYVEVRQPYIKYNILDELVKKKCVVKNVDIKVSEGVDIVGDIGDPLFVERLLQMKPDAVICGNVLEQVADREAFSRALQSLIGDQTLLIISVPRAFPYHEDPIDTMYRSSLEDLTHEFPLLRLVEGKNVSGGFYFTIMAKKLSKINKLWFFFKRVIKFVLLLVTLQYSKAKEVGWSFRRVSATCAVFTHNL